MSIHELVIPHHQMLPSLKSHTAPYSQLDLPSFSFYWSNKIAETFFEWTARAQMLLYGVIHKSEREKQLSFRKVGGLNNCAFVW